MALETSHLRLAVDTVVTNICAPQGEDTRVLVGVRT